MPSQYYSNASGALKPNTLSATSLSCQHSLYSEAISVRLSRGTVFLCGSSQALRAYIRVSLLIEITVVHNLLRLKLGCRDPLKDREFII